MDRDTDRPGDPGQPSGAGTPKSHGRTATPRGPGKRGVDFHFKWRFGHDPNDDDTTKASPWRFINWDPYTETPPNQTKELVGGPEAFPCPDCKAEDAIMRIVAEKKPTEIIGNSDVIRLGKQVDPAKVNTDTIFLVVCPKCLRKMQIPGKFLRDLRRRTLGKEFRY